VLIMNFVEIELSLNLGALHPCPTTSIQRSRLFLQKGCAAAKTPTHGLIDPVHASFRVRARGIPMSHLDLGLSTNSIPLGISLLALIFKGLVPLIRFRPFETEGRRGARIR
jgi:hypothetical protein